MNNRTTTSFQETLAKAVSVIFHPLLIPLYGMIIIFTAPTLFWYIPLKVKRILLLVIAANNVLIPISLMPFFRYRSIIQSWVMETRRERVIPLLTVSLLYSITTVIMFRLQIPIFLKGYVFATSFIAISATIINFWWKISLHSIGAGAITGLIVVLSVKMTVPLTWFLIPSVLLTGLIMSSRLRLNSHNGAQVYTGFATGFTGMILFMMLF
jgi:hypothetical protein